MEKISSKSKSKLLFNKNLLLLWQGQMISVLGDVLYMIALNFWVLEKTGSTAIMGSINAIFFIPLVVIGPFAGVIVDRYSRKYIIVITDFLRGLAGIVLGILAFTGSEKVWMFFAVALLNGVCKAFFMPALSSIKPELVSKEMLYKANSMFSFAQSGVGMLGNALGGILFITIGAPALFLFNGISFILSAFSELFIKIPKKPHPIKKLTFKQDMKIGWHFLWQQKTLRNIFICASGINFLANGGLILFAPYFKETSFLGIDKYGYAMTCLSVGMLIGSFTLTHITLKTHQKFPLYKLSLIACSVLFVLVPLIGNFYGMMLLIVASFFFNSIFNILFQSLMMGVIPDEIRGKVMALTTTIIQSLTPLGMMTAGLLAELFPIKWVMVGVFMGNLIISIICVRVKGSKELVEANI